MISAISQVQYQLRFQKDLQHLPLSADKLAYYQRILLLIHYKTAQRDRAFKKVCHQSAPKYYEEFFIK